MTPYTLYAPIAPSCGISMAALLKHIDTSLLYDVAVYIASKERISVEEYAYSFNVSTMALDIMITGRDTDGLFTTKLSSFKAPVDIIQHMSAKSIYLLYYRILEDQENARKYIDENLYDSMHKSKVWIKTLVEGKV